MSLKTLSIGALARAMASTAVIGAVTFGAGFAVAATPTPAAVNALKMTIENAITQAVADVRASNPNATDDEVAEAVAAAVANVTRGVDGDLALAALNAVQADAIFMASLPSNIAGAVRTALSAVRTTVQQTQNTSGDTTGDTTGDVSGAGDGGSSGFGSTGGSGSGGGGGGGGQHNQ